MLRELKSAASLVRIKGRMRGAVRFARKRLDLVGIRAQYCELELTAKGTVQTARDRRLFGIFQSQRTYNRRAH